MLRIIPSGPYRVNSLIVSLGGSDVFIVDPAACRYKNGDDKLKISSFLMAEGLNPVAFVLTHGHFDHVCGLSHLKSLYPEVPVLIHQEDAVWIGKDGFELQKKALEYCGHPEFLETVQDMPEADGFLLGEKTLFDCEILKSMCAEGKISPQSTDELKKWKVFHTPGHSRGSVCLYNAEKNFLFVGDTIFYDGEGRTDLPFGNRKELKKSKDEIYGRFPCDALVYPGHDYSGFKLMYSRPLFY